MTIGDDVQIWDDIPGPRPSPEALARMTAWFRKLRAEGKISVLIVRIKDDRLGSTEKGDAQLRGDDE